MKARNKTLLHYDAILFDVDGTLIDSAPGIIHTLQEVFCTMGVDVSGVNLRRYLGPPLRKSFGEHFTDPALIEKATNLYRTSYAVKGSHECAVFPGVLQMLQTLKQAGFILCTATSKPTKVVTPILEEQGLAQYFDFIGGASMDESRDTKTEVVRYVLSQPACRLRSGCCRCAVWLRQQGRAGTLPSGAAGRKLRRPYRPAAGSPDMTGSFIPSEGEWIEYEKQ